MTEPDVLADYSKLNELAQERSDIEPIVLAYRAHAAATRQLAEARELAEMGDDPSPPKWFRKKSNNLPPKLRS